MLSYKTLDKRPDIPSDWKVFNAPRPLYGHKDWIGDFKHGVFYVAVAPNGDLAEHYLLRNHQLDAWEVLYTTEEDFIQWRDAFYKEDNVDWSDTEMLKWAKGTYHSEYWGKEKE